MLRDKGVLEQFVWEVCREMKGYCVYKSPWYLRHMSPVVAYVIHADGGKGIVAVILHMCRELEWHCSHGLCMCLIDYTSGCPMLHVYLIVIPYIIYVECYLHDKTPLSTLDWPSYNLYYMVIHWVILTL